MSPASVRLWALSTCPWCRKTKQWFRDNGVDYEFVDVDLLSDAEYDQVVADVQRLSGARTYPIVQIGDTVIVGFAPDKYARALGFRT